MKRCLLLFLAYNLLIVCALFVYEPSRNFIALQFADRNVSTKPRSADLASDKKVEYQRLPMKKHFIVAGHAYGHHEGANLGMNDKLFHGLEQMRSDSTEFIVFTGDVVRSPDSSHFAAFENQMTKLQLPYYLALGNHDNSSVGLELMNEKYGKPFYAFTDGQNQFIFLNTEDEMYEPAEEQLHFLSTVLDSSKADNIFLFTHKLMWLNHSPLVDDMYDNHGKKYFNNVFWKSIFPKLVNTNKDVYCIAGDVGGHDHAPAGSYEKIGKVSLISSGMGHVKDENVLVIYIDDEVVNIKAMFLKDGSSADVSDFMASKVKVIDD